jgi:hypothetical protein
VLARGFLDPRASSSTAREEGQVRASQSARYGQAPNYYYLGDRVLSEGEVGEGGRKNGRRLDEAEADLLDAFMALHPISRLGGSPLTRLLRVAAIASARGTLPAVLASAGDPQAPPIWLKDHLPMIEAIAAGQAAQLVNIGGARTRRDEDLAAKRAMELAGEEIDEELLRRLADSGS